MTQDLSETFDPVTEDLMKAAENNDVPTCQRCYGMAQKAAHIINAKALRIAAEARSYEAFEAMLDLSVDSLFTSRGIALGEDLQHVEALAEEDETIALLLQEHDKKSEAAMDRLLNEAPAGERRVMDNVWDFISRL